MWRTIYGRLLFLCMVMLVVVVLISTAFSSFSIRTEMVNSRLQSLLNEARDIAYLASRTDTAEAPSDGLATTAPPSSTSENFSAMTKSTAMSFLQWKISSVYEEYGAYILVLDRNGRVMDNMNTALEGSVDALDTLDPSTITTYLSKVLEGEEMQATITNASQGAMLTVAVPWVIDEQVKGAVFIHTSTQVVEASFRALFLQICFVFSVTGLIAMIGASIYTKSIVKPLTIITSAAENMSRNQLNTRVHVTGVDEVCQLAGAFNIMASKLEQVEEHRREFVANVSHELRTPVTSIHGFVEGMLDGTIPQEDFPEYLQIVSDETNRMKRLITDLLQLSRMDKNVDKLQYSDFDINELIRRAIIARMNDIEALDVVLDLHFSQEACMVHADQDRILQVVTNILDNALKYISSTGNLTIHTRLMHDKVACIDICNDGPAIEPEDMPHLFERFYMAEKAHTTGKGTGLGLSICSQIITMHGQYLEVLPLTTGAGFRFTLQASADKLSLPPHVS